MILVVAAMEVEAIDLIGNMELIEKKPFPIYVGQILGKPLRIVISGIGKANAAGALSYVLSKYDIDFILNIGFVGGYKLSINKPYLISRSMYHDFDLSLFGYEKGQVPKLPSYFSSSLESLLEVRYPVVQLYTGDYFSIDAHSSEPYASDMEGNAFYQMAYRFNKPIIALKIVSDVIGTNNQLDSYKLSEKKLGSILCTYAIDVIANLK